MAKFPECDQKNYWNKITGTTHDRELQDRQLNVLQKLKDVNVEDTQDRRSLLDVPPFYYYYILK